MADHPTSDHPAERLGARRARQAQRSTRTPDYRRLQHPFTPQAVFSDDRVTAIHEAALRVLQELGLRVLLPEAVEILRRAGARVDADGQQVRIGRDIVEAALALAPRRFECRAGSRERDLTMALGAAMFMAGCGSPNATDLARGRRAGSLADFEDLVRLNQSFDVLHIQGPYVEPQDVAAHLRHYAFMRAQLALSDKLPFVYARGSAQTRDAFEMLRRVRGLDEAAFAAEVHCYTNINTNSPRQLDIPMAQGIIDFARAGQASIITPFCLAGAMAPITVAGALTLQHAEALAGITLAQLSRGGAPVLYGSFASNVDMKSGAPAFGTPEHVQATLGSGQLARLLGLPWRSGAGSAANVADAQAAHETQLSLWGSLLAGATVCIHAAGWLEGGLTFSYEKLITDLEVLQSMAELCAAVPADDAALAFDAIAEVAPGGHFFAARHTMARYQSAFYAPLVADLSNHGTWTEHGAQDATRRALGVWQRTLERFRPPASAEGADDALAAFIERRTREGGAPPAG